SVLAAATAADLGYGDPRGSAVLRRELSGWLARTRGVGAAPDDLVVVTGVAQALALTAQVLHARGHRCIAVEDPGSRGAREQLAHWGPVPVGVGVDDDGLDVAALAGTAAAAVLVTPAHQFPTGVVLGPARRRALLAWAAERDGLVVEDDYDAEHRYDRRPVPALQAGAPERVVYMGSTSKVLAPGLRLGWLLAPGRLRAQVVAAKHASDICSPVLPQLVLAHLLATGVLERHLRLVRRRQRQRRDALLAGLREHLPAARVHGVAAGLHLLVTLPGSVPEAEVVADLASGGVRVQPLAMHRLRPGPPGLVLGYAATGPDLLREAAAAIGAAVARS
ncbi:PLP-dependent aminotransferase family protein, partial [Kineococcus glutinatus]|uniref:aminotransferase-like domain-containing protein n=1 Tax=Kineococcus glutinatus TaxID=1070872 RepID=UPI0031EA4089